MKKKFKSLLLVLAFGAGLGVLGNQGVLFNNNPTIKAKADDIVDTKSATLQFGTNTNYIKLNDSSFTHKDSLDLNWKFTTSGTDSFTQQKEYCQIGSSRNPASSISLISDFYATDYELTSFNIKFGGFNGTEGTIVCKYGGIEIAEGPLDGKNDVTISMNSSVDFSNIDATKGFDINVSNIAKGVKLYSIDYTLTKKLSVDTSEIEYATNMIESMTKLAYRYNKNTSTTKYVKISKIDDLTDGDYLIVCESNSVAFDGSLTEFDASKNIKNVTIKNNEIYDELSDYTFTINKLESNNYSIKSKSNYYIGRKSAGKGLDSDKTNKLENSISFDKNSNVSIKSFDCTLQYNKNGNMFRYYSSNQTAIQLYKKVDKESFVYSNVDFRLFIGYKTSDLEIFDDVNYSLVSTGLRLKTSDKSKTYLSTSFTFKDDGEYSYLLIDLKDCINDLDKAKTEFTLEFVSEFKLGEINNVFASSLNKTFSVVSLIKEYYGNETTKSTVEDLYNYYNDNGLYAE